MKRLVLTTAAAIALAAPAAATAQDTFYAASVDGLDGASITFKLRGSQPVKVQAETRALCEAPDGGPAANTRLINFFRSPDVDDRGVFRDRQELGRDGAYRAIRGRPDSIGFHGRYSSVVTSTDKDCSTGTLRWQAVEVTEAEWLEIRDYQPHP